MNSCWKIDTSEQRKALLAHIRNVALMVLQQYDLAWTEIKFNKVSDAITFKITTETEACFLLRIHNEARQKSEIEGEIMLLNYLESQNMTVPTGQKSKSDKYVLEFETKKGETLYVTLMSWVDGDVLTSAPTDTQARNMGRILAQIHHASESFVPEENQSFPHWGLETFRENMKKLSQYHSIFLSQEGWEMYQNVADTIIVELENTPKCSQNYGFVHGDFHLENIIFKEDVPFPIDFGRCGYSYFLYDIASTILGLNWQNRKNFVEGYTGLKKLKDGYERLLETMFVKVMIENYCHHCSDPSETEGLIAEQPYAQAYIQAYLQRRSFLFEPLDS